MQGAIYVTPPPRFSDSDRRIIDTGGPTRRVYQLWQGSNRFFLGGRLIFGPDVRSLFLTVFLIVAPVALFAVFVYKDLVQEFQHHIAKLIVVVSIAFASYDLFFLLLTSSRDPGIVPRNDHPPELEDDDKSNISSEWGGTQVGANGLPPTKDVLVNGIIVKVKYCHTCMLYRPPRCSHCSICNNCVERFDHHCPWVGQCIGKRNYRFFFMFVSSTTLLCLYVFAFCWVNIKKIMDVSKCNLWHAMKQSPISGMLIAYTFVAAWFVGGLTIFHLYLTCTNQTTYENFRYRYDGKVNPYNRGCVRNIRETFFSRIPISQNNFRAKVKEDLSAYNTSPADFLSPDSSKNGIDLEMGGKRKAVAMEELAEIASQIGSVRGLERCGTQPAHRGWAGGPKGGWDMSPDLQVFAAELDMEHVFTGIDRMNHNSLKQY